MSSNWRTKGERTYVGVELIKEIIIFYLYFQLRTNWIYIVRVNCRAVTIIELQNILQYASHNKICMVNQVYCNTSNCVHNNLSY